MVAQSKAPLLWRRSIVTCPVEQVGTLSFTPRSEEILRTLLDGMGSSVSSYTLLWGTIIINQGRI